MITRDGVAYILDRLLAPEPCARCGHLLGVELCARPTYLPVMTEDPLVVCLVCANRDLEALAEARLTPTPAEAQAHEVTP